ncbi:hypothetical protein Bca4012_045274 [Brassica carinata]
MKKKKPKKSPGKSPPKRPSPAKSSPPSLFDAVDLVIHADLIVSDAQSCLPAGAVAQQSEGATDLVATSADASSNQTVIVASPTDPSSANEVSVIVPESRSASPQSTDHEEPASIACKAAPLNPHKSATVESSPASPKSSSAVAPVELPIGDDKMAPSSPLPLATADANDGSSSQLASGETETESHFVRDKPAKGVSVAVGAFQPPLNVVLQDPGKAIDPPKPDWTEAGVSYDTILPRSAPLKDQEQPRVQKSLACGGELKWIPTNSPANQAITSGSLQVEVATNSKLGTATDRVIGETSGTVPIAERELPRSSSRSDQSDVQPDSLDVESSDSELEEGEFSKHEQDFEVVRNRKRFSGQKGKRGRGHKIN